MVCCPDDANVEGELMDFLEKLLESHRTYWAMIGESKTSAVLAIAIASLAGLFELMTLFLIAPLLGLSFKIDFQGVVGKVFAFIASNETLSNPWVQFSALLAVVAMSIGARWVAFRYFVNLRFTVIVRLRLDMLDQMIEMPWPRYHRVAGGSITSSLGQAVWQIGEGIEQYLQMIANFFIVVVLVSAKHHRC
jgi:ABC-type multidrug transport system fused ATPase/permease subunit